ncbi:MAG: hypothetical protein ACREDO_07920 [Methyloceanibacter sp.]
MAKSPKLRGGSKAKARTAEPRFPDPKLATGPYKPFTCGPGWGEAWWWLGFPILVTAFTIGSYQLDPAWYMRYVIPEGYGVLEVSHFFLPMFGLMIAAGLLFLPFVRARAFTFTLTLLVALACLYIAGEEMSWGQHFFQWNTPEYWAAVNRQQETNLHNTYYVFEKLPRNLLELGVVIGGLLVPLAAAFYPSLRANRFSLFLPPSALVPTALGAVAFKAIDRLDQIDVIGTVLQRPSETIETYLYFFIFGYLVVYARRIRQLEAEEGVIGGQAHTIRHGWARPAHPRLGTRAVPKIVDARIKSGHDTGG